MPSINIWASNFTGKIDEGLVGWSVYLRPKQEENTQTNGVRDIPFATQL